MCPRRGFRQPSSETVVSIRKSVSLNHLSVCLAKRQLVAAHGDLDPDRPAALPCGRRSPHRGMIPAIHDAAAGRTLALNLRTVTVEPTGVSQIAHLRFPFAIHMSRSHLLGDCDALCHHVYDHVACQRRHNSDLCALDKAEILQELSRLSFPPNGLYGGLYTNVH